MIEQQATVVAAADGAAWVEVPRQSSCSACGHGSSCGTATLAQLLGNGRSTRAQIRDHLGLRVGERVVIGIHGPLLARASLAAYLLPLIALIATASLAEQAGLGDGWTALLGIGALLLGLWVAGRLATGRLFTSARFAECPATRNQATDDGLQPLLLRRIDGAGIVVQPSLSRREPHP